MIYLIFLICNALLFMNYYSALKRIEKEENEELKQYFTKEINRVIN